MWKICDLPRMRKRATVAGTALAAFLVVCLCFAAPALAAEALPGQGEGSLDMGTRTGGAAIGQDPYSGDRTLATPPPRQQPQDNTPLLIVPQIEPNWRPPGPRPREPYPVYRPNPLPPARR